MLRLALFLTGILVVSGLGSSIKYQKQTTRSGAVKTSVSHKQTRIPSVTKSFGGIINQTSSTFDKNHPENGRHPSTAKIVLTSGKFGSTKYRNQPTPLPRHTEKQNTFPSRQSNQSIPFSHQGQSTRQTTTISGQPRRQTTATSGQSRRKTTATSGQPRRQTTATSGQSRRQTTATSGQSRRQTAATSGHSRRQTAATSGQPRRQITTVSHNSSKENKPIFPNRHITDIPVKKSTNKINVRTNDQPSTKSKYHSTVGHSQRTTGSHEHRLTSLKHKQTTASSKTPLPHRNYTFPTTNRHLATGYQQTASLFFVCRDGVEILSSAQCDGIVDCPDGSDENSNQCTPCPAGFFPCDNRNCVQLAVTCDNVDNCGDGSDEYTSICQGGLHDVFTCANGQVLKGEYLLCNGVYNCADKSDEINCNICDEGMLCDNGMNCVKASSVCDRIRDCADGTDELCLGNDSQKCKLGEYLCISGKCLPEYEIDMLDTKCYNTGGQPLQNSTVNCEEPKLLCDGGRTCVPNSKRCDGVIDCQDKTDEVNIDSTAVIGAAFKCTNGYCLSYMYVCDGKDDCGDGSDESLVHAGCSPVSENCKNKFRCDNGVCVETYKVNNGIDDCGDGSDEKNNAASMFTCLNGMKIKNSYVCDGMDDCGDNSDEKYCPGTINSGGSIQNPSQTSCPEHTCPSGTCIYYRDICDGFDDCGDNSDERSCHSWPWTNSLAIGLSISGGLFLTLVSVFIFRYRRRRLIAASRTINGSGLRSITYSEIPPFSQMNPQQDQGYSNPMFWDSSVQLTNGK